MKRYADQGLITSIENELLEEVKKIYTKRGGVFTKMHPHHILIRADIIVLAYNIANNLIQNFSHETTTTRHPAE